MTGEQPLPSALVHGIQQLEPMPVTAQRLLAMMNGEDVQRRGQEHRCRPGRRGFNLTIDSGCVRRLGLDFTKFARICLQTETWLRELRAAEKPPVRT